MEENTEILELDGCKISRRFVDAVSAHLVMNAIDISSLRIPLILGIHGPAGEGKTRQCEIIFKHMNVRPVWLSADLFENERAGEPARLLEEKYRDASEFNHGVRECYREKRLWKQESLRVLFINDIDLRIGRKDSLIQQTINTQQVNALLMQLADDPKRFADRVPIIITGNNFESIHKPLLRDGRADKFEWKPTYMEKFSMIQGIFPHLEEEDIWELVSDFTLQSDEKLIDVSNLSKNSPSNHRKSGVPDLPPISFFAMLRYSHYKTSIMELIKGIELKDILPYILSGQYKFGYPSDITLDQLRETAQQLRGTSVFLDHLEDC